MFIWTTHFSRKKAVWTVIAMGIVMVVLILLSARTSNEMQDSLPTLTDNSQRVEYIQSLGWEIVPEPLETLQFLLPPTLEEPYLSYNQLQLEQGFDLTDCCGKQLSRYTYTVKNYPEHSDDVQLNLYVCENLPVAGDLTCPGEQGFQVAMIPSDAENS